MDKLHDGSIMRRVNMLGENLAEPSKIKVEGVVIGLNLKQHIT